MARLTRLKPRLSHRRPVSAVPSGRQAYDAARDKQEWRRWYKTARWQRLRMVVLTRDLFTCQSCWRIVADTSQLVADHRRAHRGDEVLFWDELNLQCLCKRCHDSAKQREEHRSGR